MKLKNEIYDTLKYIAMIVLPALATFVVAVCRIWGLPFGAEISGTIIAIDTFLGALLQVSSNNYKKDEE